MQSHFLKYGRRFIIFSSALLLITILFSHSIDPFSVYGRVYFKDGIEVNSPAFSAQVKMGKALAINQRKPEILIMGSSRSLFGFSYHVAEQYFPKQNIYNISFSGVTFYEILRYFQHAVASSSVKQVYIGLDFYQFHGGRLPEKTFREDRLAVDINNQSSGSAINDLISTLLSVDAVFYSVKVFAGLYRSDDDTFLTNGFINKEHACPGLSAFLKSEEGYINKVYTVPEFTFKTIGNQGSTLDYFKQIVQLAHEKQINLYFFISPPHARQWEVITQLGLWRQWEQWKREILSITEQESKRYLQSAFSIYDFSGYSIYSTENVPRNGKQEMQWYCDSAHYKQALGNIILDKMLNAGGQENFGRILSTKNIDAHLRAIKVDRLEYQSSHQQDIKDIQELIKNRNNAINSFRVL